MVEHIGRYDYFMRFLAQNGYVAVAHDHLGHKGSVANEEDLGYFAKTDGYKCILDDLSYTASRTRKMFPQLKLVLLGHSMGSFYARVFAGRYPQLIDGLIISGTGGTNRLAGIGEVIINLLIMIKGDRYRSNFVKNLSFKGFLSKIDGYTSENDWISSDKEMVKLYNEDKYCSFIFTLSGFRDLAMINSLSNNHICYEYFKNTIPVYIFSGLMDPVGNYGKGVREVYDKLKSHGVKDISLKLYENGRHEMLNETNREQVYSDVLAWLNNHISA